jgi:hypothetical protein
MSDAIETLTAVLRADTAQYTAALKEAMGATRVVDAATVAMAANIQKLVDAQLKAAAESRAAAAAARETAAARKVATEIERAHAEALREAKRLEKERADEAKQAAARASEGYQQIASAARSTLEALRSLAESSLAVANRLDPRQGREYAHAMRELNDSIQTAEAAFGRALRPAVEAVANTLTNLIDNFNALDGSTKGTIATVLEVVGAIAAVIVAIAGLAAAYAAVTTAAAAFGITSMAAAGTAIAGWAAALAPVLAVAAGVAGVIGIVVALKQVWDANVGGIQETTARVFAWLAEKANWIKGVFFDAFAGIRDHFIDMAESWLQTFGSVFDFLKSHGIMKGLADSVSQEVEGVVSGLEGLKKDLTADGMTKDLKAGAAWGAGKLVEAGKAVGDFIKTGWDGSSKTLSDMLAQIKSKLGLDKLFGEKAGAHQHVQTDEEQGAEIEAGKRRLEVEKAIAEMRTGASNFDLAIKERIVALQRGELEAQGKALEDQLSQQKAMLDRAYSEGDEAGAARAKAGVEGALSGLKAVYAEIDAQNRKGIADAAKDLESKNTQRMAFEARVAQVQEAEAAAQASYQKALADGDAAHLAASKAAADAAHDATMKAIEQAKAMQGQATSAAAKLTSLQVQGAAQAADHQRKVNDETRSLWQTVGDHLKAMAGYFKGQAAGLLTGGGGITSSVAQAAIEGGKTAGAEGALTGALTALVSNSAGYAKLFEALNGVLQGLSDAVGKVLEAVAPLIAALGTALAPIFAGLGDLLLYVGRGLTGALMPLVGMIGQLAAPVGHLLSALAPLFQVLVEVGLVIMLAMQGPLPLLLEAFVLLVPMLELLARVTEAAIHGVTQAWNFVLEAVQSLLRSLGNLPGVGDEAKRLADSLESLRIHAVSFGTAVDHATVAVNQFADSVLKDMQSMADATAKMSADAAALNYALNHPDADPAKQAAIVKALQDALAKDQQALIVATDQKAIDEARKAYADNPNYQTNQAITDAMAKLAYDQASFTDASTANTAATTENTKVTQSVVESLTNLPGGFKLNLQKYYADAGTGSGVSSVNNAGFGQRLAQGGQAADSAPVYVFNFNGEPTTNQMQQAEEFVRRQNARAGRSRRLYPGPARPGGRG